MSKERSALTTLQGKKEESRGPGRWNQRHLYHYSFQEKKVIVEGEEEVKRSQKKGGGKAVPAHPFLKKKEMAELST